MKFTRKTIATAIVLLITINSLFAQIVIDTATNRNDSVGNQRFMLSKGKYMGNGVFKTNTGKTITIDPQTQKPKVENSNGSKTELDKIEDKLKESEEEFAEKLREEIKESGDGYKLAAAFAKAMEDIEKEKQSLKKLTEVIQPFDEDLEDYFNEQKIKQAQDKYEANIDSKCREIDGFLIELKEFLVTHNGRISTFNITEPPARNMFATCYPCENANGRKDEQYYKLCDEWQTQFLEPKCADMIRKCFTYVRMLESVGYTGNVVIESGSALEAFENRHVGRMPNPKPCFNAVRNIDKLWGAVSEIVQYLRNKTLELNKRYGKKHEFIMPVISTVLDVERTVQLTCVLTGDDRILAEMARNVDYLLEQFHSKKAKNDFRILAYMPSEFSAARAHQIVGGIDHTSLKEIVSFPYFKLTIETEFKLADQSVSDDENHTQHSGYVLAKMKSESQLIAVYDSTDCIKWFTTDPGTATSGLDEQKLLTDWKITYGEILADGKSYKYVSPLESKALAASIKLNFCGSTGIAKLDIPIPSAASGVTWTYPTPPPHGPDLFTLLTTCFTPMKIENGNIDRSKIEGNAKKMEELGRKMQQGLIKPEDAAKQIQKLQAEVMKLVSPSENFLKDLYNVHVDAPFQNFNKTIIDYQFDGKSVSKIGSKLVYAFMKIKLEHQPKR